MTTPADDLPDPLLAVKLAFASLALPATAVDPAEGGSYSSLTVASRMFDTEVLLHAARMRHWSHVEIPANPEGLLEWARRQSGMKDGKPVEGEVNGQ